MFVAQLLVTVRESMRRFFKKTWRAVRYLCLFVWSILCHILLLTLTIAPLALPALALFVLYVYWETVEGYIGSFFEEEKRLAAQALSLLIGAGVLTWVITTLGKCALNQLREIGRAVGDVWSKGWSLGGKSLEKLEASWRDYIDTVPCDAWKAFKRAHLLTISLMLCVLLVVMYPILDPKPPPQPAQTVHSTQNVYRYVAMFDARDTSQGTTDVIIQYLTPGTIFALVHKNDAQPKSGNGVCLDEPQREWLDVFRRAIETCVAQREYAVAPTFEVTGYASIAPMHVGGDIRKSEKLNCKVANWRAAAVGAYLANPDNAENKKWWCCDDVEQDFNKTLPNECGDFAFTKKPLDGTEDDDGKPMFHVEVRKWSDPGQMIGSKPVDDGAVPNPRRFDVELLNRVVHIKVPEDFCRATVPGAGTS